MSDKAPPASAWSAVGIALRLATFIALVVAATWAAFYLRDMLDMTIRPENEGMIHRLLMVSMVAYIGLLAIPFVPGAEVGLAMITAFGAAIAPLVYLATVMAMMLAYTIGRLMPETTLARLLALVRLRRAAALASRAAALPREERLALLLEGAPPRTVGLALRYRYVALALSVNVPGNAVIGGGGGIMMMAGMSGIFAPFQTLLAVMIAVSPVPLAVMLMGA